MHPYLIYPVATSLLAHPLLPLASPLAWSFRALSAQRMHPLQRMLVPPEIGVWVVIQPNDTVVIRVVRSEMGQGTITGLAQLVAEELECNWSKITIDYPTPGESLKRKGVWGSFLYWR
jgi:CO/xanthine dehydrogenase Mo-binding subunit